MKQIGIITKTKVENKTISKLLIDNFPFSKKIVQNDEIQLFLGKYPNNFSIDFDISSFMDDPNLDFDKEQIDQIPFDPAHFNFIQFWNINVIKYVVKTIYEVFPELIIYDDENDKLVSASEFLKD